jgi:membrane-associated protease RseP (regulator of RpoE activity)
MPEPLAMEAPPVIVVRPPRRPYLLHLALFLLTIFTTLIVGAHMQHNFNTGQPLFDTGEHLFPWRWVFEDPQRLWMGVPFSLSLLGILFAHEMGHFVLAVRNRVYATLPFFIPAPTLIGTFGAFIQIKSRFQSRQALFDIGIGGPIAGFVVAIPITLVGILLSRPLPASAGEAEIGYPLIFYLVQLLVPNSAPLAAMLPHPVAIAAWVGMLATTLNLMPGGQLDGGHMLYALSPAWHARITKLTIIALLPLAYYFWSGWLIWAVALLVTRRHPAVPLYPELEPSRRRLALLGFGIFVLTFVPAPFVGGSIWEILHG